VNYNSSPKVDIWALGIILYNMLFGKYPFDATKDSDIFDKIVKEDHKFPTDIIVSDICYKLLNGLLCKNPKNRLEMSDPLFEEWYKDPGSDTPIIITNKSNSSDTVTNSFSVSPRKIGDPLKRPSLKLNSNLTISHSGKPSITPTNSYRAGPTLTTQPNLKNQIVINSKATSKFTSKK
jgi:serine/threonine protein kinase